LPGNPLDVEALGASGAARPRLLVAVDPAEENGSSLIALDKEGGGWRETKIETLPAGGDMSISTAELQKILYSTEILRKLSDFD
jgi:tRNA (guanine-N(7)-)-methyltransferase subunit TRM82